ncbi:MAG: GtrA family protein [Bacilli bacterium]|nr:GtrA family protein [Bacilli bacterium]
MKKLIKQLFKFGVVGGSAFLIDYGFLALLTEVFSINYLISSAVSFTLSVIYNYALSVIWVFEVDSNSNPQKNFIIFLILSILGLLFNQFLMWCGTDLLNIHYLIIKIVATILVMIYNFITRKIFLEK